MSDEGGGSAATRTRSKARVMQEMDANATTGGPKLPPSSAQTMSKIQSRCVRLVVDSRRIKNRFRITRKMLKQTSVWWWSSWTKVVFFVGKEDIFLIPLFQRTIFSSSSSRIKIFSNHAARTPLPSPPKKRTVLRDDRW